MSVKREAGPFIKPDPDAKRVKREGAEGGFSLSSIPMAPPPTPFTSSSTSSDVVSKVENGDRKPLGPAPNFGGQPGQDRKKKRFSGNSIKVRRGEDWVSAHFNKRTMMVHFVMHCTITKQWSSVEVEKEIFERLNNAKFFIQPSENWGFLDRKYNAAWAQVTIHPDPSALIMDHPLKVKVNYSSTNKVENSPFSLKKPEPNSQLKKERL